MQAWKDTYNLRGDKNLKRKKKTRTVTDLINSLLLLARQVSLPVGGIFLEEVANFVTRGKEVVVTDVVFVSGGELRLHHASCMHQIADMRVA
jgi:hypothetical protein